MVTNLKIKRSYLFFPDKEKKATATNRMQNSGCVFVGLPAKSILM